MATMILRVNRDHASYSPLSEDQSYLLITVTKSVYTVRKSGFRSMLDKKYGKNFTVSNYNQHKTFNMR